MRFPLRPFERLPSFDFMRHHRFWMWSSNIVMLVSFLIIALNGFNYGIDFVGGKLVQVQTAREVSVADIRRAVEGAGFDGFTVQQYGAPTEYLIRLPGNDPKVQPTTAEAQVLDAVAAMAGGAEKRRVEFVGPQVGEELRWKGLLATLISLAAVTLYVAFRFEFTYGLGALTGLMHDILFTLAVLSILQTEITLTVLAAILTLVGYSLNDTIVIFDRIRENRGRYPNRPVPEVMNLSVNQTLGRTVMTVSTVLLVLVAIYLKGGEVIHDFSVVMLLGVIVGTYSSVFVASPSLLSLEEWSKNKAKKEEK